MLWFLRSTFSHWRSFARALGVCVKVSQSWLGSWLGAVSISTISPFLSSVRNGWIFPLIRDPLLGDAMHLVGADLHLERLSLVAHHGSVQRLIHVRLEYGDETLDPTRERAPETVDDPEGAVAA